MALYIQKNFAPGGLANNHIWRNYALNDGLWIKAPTPPTITPGFYGRVGYVGRANMVPELRSRVRTHPATHFRCAISPVPLVC